MTTSKRGRKEKKEGGRERERERGEDGSVNGRWTNAQLVPSACATLIARSKQFPERAFCLLGKMDTRRSDFRHGGSRAGSFLVKGNASVFF